MLPEDIDGRQMDVREEDGNEDADSTLGMEERTMPPKDQPRHSKSWRNLLGLFQEGGKESEGPPHRKPPDEHQASQDKSFSRKALKWLKKRVTFYRIHFTAFFLLMLLGSLVIYLSPNGSRGSLGFIDSMYIATSAVCCVGLFPVYMNQLSTFDQVFLLFLNLIGCQVFASLVPVLVRRYYFKKYLEREGIFEVETLSVSSGRLEDRLKEVAEGDIPTVDEEEELAQSQRVDLGHSQRLDLGQSQRLELRVDEGSGSARWGRHGISSSRRGEDTARGQRAPGSGTPQAGTADAWGINPDAAGTPGKAFDRQSSTANILAFLDDGPNDRSTNTWAGETAQINARRLKAFLDATKQQQQQQQQQQTPGRPGDAWGTPLLRTATSRLLNTMRSGEEESVIDTASLLPGERRFIELRSLEMLTWLVPVYMFGCLITAFIIFNILLFTNPYYLDILKDAGINPVLMAAFQSTSAFVNFGVNLLDDNLARFLAYVPYILLEAALILLGNTMYAPTLRFLLIIISRWGTQQQRFVARYLLEHPRKCYTHLFPASDTKWLVLTVVLFNSVEFVFFCILDWNTPALTGLDTGDKILAGIFQSISTRNAGTTVITISLLSPAMLVLYAGMMYVAVYPVYITRQRSRQQREVLDDEDLRIFYEDLDGGVMEKGVLGQAKKMVGRDSALLFLSVFLICIIERDEMVEDPLNYSIFNIVFEVLSAYGNVGLSIGYTCPAENPPPDCVSVPYSFSGVWRDWGKFFIIMIMFLGRHRGLPDNIDAAIVIPDQKQFQRVAPTAEAAPMLTKMTSAAGVASVLPRSTSTSLMPTMSIHRPATPSASNIRTVSGDNMASPF